MKQIKNKPSSSLIASALKNIILPAALLLGAANTSFGQASCLLPSLVVNTGIDPATGGGVLPPGVNDPKWQVTALSPDNITATGCPLPPFQSWVINAAPGWTTTAVSGWISFIVPNNYTTNTAGTYTDQYTRCFEVCVPGDFKIDLNIGCDDQITNISMDGTSFSTGSPFTAPNMGNFNVLSNVSTTLTLTQGQHCITVDAMNYPWKQTVTNYHGVNIVGSVTSATGTPSIVSEDAKCKGYVCEKKDTCDDICYWRVTGNYIHSGNNIFGTLSNDDIRIVSNNTDRAVVTAGGFMGIAALTPSTTLDVDCVPTSAPSGLRLENLPVGHGNALVVDANGYVYAAQSVLYRNVGESDLQSEVAELKKEVQELKAMLGMTAQVAAAEGHSLSATPNPSNGQVNVNYNIVGAFNSASIRVIDMQGKLVLVKSISNNAGAVNMTLPTSLASGNLIISLEVDGKVVARQQEALVK